MIIDQQNPSTHALTASGRGTVRRTRNPPSRRGEISIEPPDVGGRVDYETLGREWDALVALSSRERASLGAFGALGGRWVGWGGGGGVGGEVAV